MEPRIEVISEKSVVGVSGQMSLAADATPALWQTLMPRRHEISNRTSDDYISMRTYESVGPEMFDPTTVFTKWAAVEVEPGTPIPAGMEEYTMAGGQYAVFIHKGPASAFPGTMQYIFATWLPRSQYQLDSREQFEILQEGYDPMDEEGQEEVWIPIR